VRMPDGKLEQLVSPSEREAGRENRNSMMRRNRRMRGVQSSPLNAAVSSLTSGTFLRNEWPRMEVMHIRRELGN
jgi:hypothetical protein